MTRHWLMKSEPDVFSIDDLQAKKRSLWDGVRNYQARNFMMKDMKVGDQVLFYHSNAEPSAVAGVAYVTGPATPDPSQFDQNSEYFDDKATPAKPRWFCVEVAFGEKFKKPVPLDLIKKEKSLQKMILLQHSRLSVQPVSATEFARICKMGGLS
jgi:predicted RNA-binding protein with PUA-like domain